MAHLHWTNVTTRSSYSIVQPVVSVNGDQYGHLGSFRNIEIHLVEAFGLCVAPAFLATRMNVVFGSVMRHMSEKKAKKSEGEFTACRFFWNDDWGGGRCRSKYFARLLICVWASLPCRWSWNKSNLIVKKLFEYQGSPVCENCVSTERSSTRSLRSLPSRVAAISRSPKRAVVRLNVTAFLCTFIDECDIVGPSITPHLYLRT